MISGLDHVQLAMPEGAENLARSFYAGTLGMREIPKPEPLAERGGVWFQGGGAQLHLGVEHAFVPATKAHPALICDLDAVRDALRDGGVAMTEDISVAGVRRFYASDPFGNRIEFIADGDGFSQR